MERLFFHIRTGGAFIADEEGMILPDMAAALTEMWASARDLCPADSGRGVIEMSDDLGNVLATIPIRRALH
jgi:hypothetical protein